jgi:hypothetical protein
MSRPRTTSTHAEVANVHNYYERLVTESILKTDARAISDPDFLADVSCVALNHLPPRYIRHDVDMSFFMSPVEREETENKVQTAVDYAIVFVKQHEEDQQEVTPDDIIIDALDSEEDMETAIAEEENHPEVTASPSDEVVEQDIEEGTPTAEISANNSTTVIDNDIPEADTPMPSVTDAVIDLGAELDTEPNTLTVTPQTLDNSPDEQPSL